LEERLRTNLDLDILREFEILINQGLLGFFVDIKVEDFLLLEHGNVSIGVLFAFL
jgi:hypothetical protein